MNVRIILTSSPFNLVVNNLFWLGCVVGREGLIILVAPAILCYVALLVRYRVVTVRQLSIPAGLGILTDSLLTSAGVFAFEHPAPILPLWMLALWLAFTTTLPLSLRALGRHPVIASLVGAAGFPLAYFAGYQAGAIEFGPPVSITLSLLAVIWAGLMPLMFKWTFRIEEPVRDFA